MECKLCGRVNRRCAMCQGVYGKLGKSNDTRSNCDVDVSLRAEMALLERVAAFYCGIEPHQFVRYQERRFRGLDEHPENILIFGDTYGLAISKIDHPVVRGSEQFGIE